MPPGRRICCSPIFAVFIRKRYTRGVRVLISRPDNIGDLVLALHGVKQLKKRLPHLEVFLQVSNYTMAFARLVTFVDGCVEATEDLTPYRFDAVVDLMAKSRAAWRFQRAKIPVRIGNSARWFRVLYNRTRWVRRSQARINEAEYNWQLICLLDPSLERTPLTETFTLDDLRDYTPYEQLSGYTLLMYSLTRSATAWPRTRWQELVRLLAAENSGPVLLLLGPAEREFEAEFRAACGDLAGAHVLCIDDFRRLIGILKGAKAYVGTSTGVTHLASAAGLPGVALYPETASMHPRRWAPFRTRLNLISLSRAPTAEHVRTMLGGTPLPELDPLRRDEVSGFVVCGNEEANIRRCLQSLAWCDELVVVDSCSRDRTVDIAREFTENLHVRPWPGHREQKQYALEQCTRKWVVNIDADEEISTELRGEMLHVLVQSARGLPVAHGYMICRLVYFLNRWWDRGGWYPEYRMRFFQRQYARWGGVNPHEKAIVEGTLGRLQGDLHHYTYSGISSQVEALHKHSSYSAQHLFSEGKRCRLHNLIGNPLIRFFKFYLLKRGFLEGLPGFIVACFEANYTFLKYVKLWELGRKAKQRDISPSQGMAGGIESAAGRGPSPRGS